MRFGRAPFGMVSGLFFAFFRLWARLGRIFGASQVIMAFLFNFFRCFNDFLKIWGGFWEGFGAIFGSFFRFFFETAILKKIAFRLDRSDKIKGSSFEKLTNNR